MLLLRIRVSFLLPLVCIVLFSLNSLFSQQVVDTSFKYSIPNPTYLNNQGSVIYIDNAHNNLHTKEGNFKPFANLLEQDGYKVESSKQIFDRKMKLDTSSILVIANALDASNLENWVLPTPSAFKLIEIENIKNWVYSGGRLLLIADHMPFAGAANELAKAFGFEFVNGFAKTSKNFWPPSQFSLGVGLNETIISEGLSPDEQVSYLTTFTGSAFKAPPSAIPLISFSKQHISLQPDTAWKFDSTTDSINLKEHYQAAIMRYGKGKLAVFGEAAMFTAQISGSIKAGFNSPYAKENAQFILNLIHWLDNLETHKVEMSTGRKGTDLSEEKEILQLNREMEARFDRKDYQAIANFYAKDGIMLGNHHQIEGIEAIRSYWSNLNQRGISWELENIEIINYEEVAIQRGISRMEIKQGEENLLSEVRFTLVWKMTKEGWKIYIDHYSLL